MKYSHEGHVERKDMSLYSPSRFQNNVSDTLEDHPPVAPCVAQGTFTGRCALILAVLL